MTYGVKNSAMSQLRWVILLLAIVVILPAVCLVWFMSQAVRNERLAVRQKLVDLYTQKFERTAERIDEYIAKQLELVEKSIKLPAEDELYSKVGPIYKAVYDSGFNGVVIFDEKGDIAYPVTSDFSQDVKPSDNSLAWRAEFAERDFEKAIKLYKQQGFETEADYPGGDFENTSQYIYNVIAQARCMLKLAGSGDPNVNRADALDRAVRMLDEVKNRDGGFYIGQVPAVLEAGHFLVELCRQAARANPANRQQYLDIAENVLTKDVARLFMPSNADRRIPDDFCVFMMDRKTAMLERFADPGYGFDPFRAADSFIQQMRDAMRFDNASLEMVANLDATPPVSFTPGSVIAVEKQQSEYVLCGQVLGMKILLGADEIIEQVKAMLSEVCEQGIITCSLTGPGGRALIAAAPRKSEPFLRTRPGGRLNGFTASVYFSDQFAWEGAAKRQVSIYIWATGAVIVLLFVTGAVAVRTIGKQIRLNRLKNDFIATVTHELKTPLASTRLLVDTILEKRYDRPEQVREYMQLIAGQNERLSRLIDHFLTFSRMERNKQVFEMQKTEPADIANAAAEAVRMKFDDENCDFIVTIDDDLPSVKADRDAMVTVLVNLLDNSYKYSGNYKRIELRVYGDGQSVCFAVKDNGIGMTRRQQKKIFERFYQADTSLARRAEGAGLGLSIVKFIVDAHHGTIEVGSAPKKGSEFKVKLRTEI